MERYIADEHGVRKAVILDIDDYKTLVRAAEDADDVRAVDEIRRALDAGDDEMIDDREARGEWQLHDKPEQGPRRTPPHLAPGGETDRQPPAP